MALRPPWQLFPVSLAGYALPLPSQCLTSGIMIIACVVLHLGAMSSLLLICTFTSSHPASHSVTVPCPFAWSCSAVATLPEGIWQSWQSNESQNVKYIKIYRGLEWFRGNTQLQATKGFASVSRETPRGYWPHGVRKQRQSGTVCLCEAHDNFLARGVGNTPRPVMS